LDFPGGANTEESARGVLVALSEAETLALLRDVPAAYGTEINDVLLTALGQTISRWSGTPVVSIDLEGHGREDLFDDVDLSRTVGWFTTLYPIHIDLSDAWEPGAALKTVKEQLRGIPNHGIGYGLLHYLGDDAAQAQLRALPPAEVSFNYLGQFDAMLAESQAYGLAGESSGPPHSPLGKRSHSLSIDGSISAGCLRMQWSYSANLHRRATIEGLAHDFLQALRELIAHCQSPEAGGYTPSDFPDVELSQEEIEVLMSEVGNGDFQG
jgi:non-ribosomal peptide synthase protein (TIGR01720 family)